MEIQTERLENHTARFTVNIDAAQFEKAKKQAARKLSKRYNIPGFRKGKAPYRIVANYLGEAPIIEDAMETLGNEIYKKALDESEIEPYGPGSLEDFKLDPVPTYIFSVPLQPEVQLGDYLSLRQDYEVPEVTDEQVDDALHALREEYALVEESSQPAALGNRLVVDIHSVFVDGEERPEDNSEQVSEEDQEHAESAQTSEANVNAEDTTESVMDEDADDEDTGIEPYKGDMFIHRHDFELTLNVEDSPILPGFSEALIGAENGSVVEFQLEIPDDEMFEGIVGRKVEFEVEVKSIEVVTLPELNDDLAARVTEDEDEQLTLLQLRMRTRENLQKHMEDQAKQEYSENMLSNIVEQATVSFPEAMVNDQIEEILREFDQSLRERGLTLDTYIKVMNTTREDVGEQSRERAEERLQRSLVMGELLEKEGITVEPEDISARIDEMVAQFGDQGASLRQFFDTPQMQSNIASELMYQKLMDRLVQIGTGQVATVGTDGKAETSEVQPTTDLVDDDEKSEQTVENEEETNSLE